MKVEIGKPVQGYRRGGQSKYQFVFDEIDKITEENALILQCDKTDSASGLKGSLHRYLRDNGLSKKLTVLLRNGSTVYVQYKKNGSFSE